MNIALIGTGKTGSTLYEVIDKKQDKIVPFNSKNPPVPSSLQGLDAAIIFVPGKPALDLIPLLLNSKIPCVWGSTGLTWPSDLDFSLKREGVSWIRSNNFGLGMSIIKNILQELQRSLNIYSSIPHEISLVETHHINKKDAPSGTALSWREWLGKPDLSIESLREEDVVGIHELKVTTPHEVISIRHESKDRGLFAKGAYVAAKILFEKKLGPGFFTFDEVSNLIFQNKIQI